MRRIHNTHWGALEIRCGAMASVGLESRWLLFVKLDRFFEKRIIKWYRCTSFITLETLPVFADPDVD